MKLLSSSHPRTVDAAPKTKRRVFLVIFIVASDVCVCECIEECVENVSELNLCVQQTDGAMPEKKDEK